MFVETEDGPMTEYGEEYQESPSVCGPGRVWIDFAQKCFSTKAPTTKPTKAPLTKEQMSAVTLWGGGQTNLINSGNY